jgi:bacterioferritin-associated ferredoxin
MLVRMYVCLLAYRYLLGCMCGSCIHALREVMSGSEMIYVSCL